MAACVGVALLGGSLWVETLQAQEPFLSYDFDTDNLNDFFLPIGVNLCGTPLPTGTAELEGGEMVIRTDELFGIGIAQLLPEVVEEKFPESRDHTIRVRFSIDEAGDGGQVTQFELGLRGHVGSDEESLLIHSEFERSYYVSVIPEFVEPTFDRGFIAISEFSECHDHIEHPEWPPGVGFAAADPGFPIIAEEWYWLEATTIGDDDGGPVQITARIWRDGDEPPEAPQLSVIDEDGLPHTEETLEKDIGFSFGLNFDIEPRPFGGSARVSDIILTPVGGCTVPPARLTRTLWGDLVDAEGGEAAVYDEGLVYEVRLSISDVRPEGECAAAGSVTVVERVPAGWEVAEISNDGAVADGVCTWAVDLSAGTDALTYTVLAMGAGLANFGGEIIEDDRVTPTEGAGRAVDSSGLSPISDFGSIQHWLVLGPFGQSGGANPGEDAIQRDYLTDGSVTEASIEPEAGDTIEPDYNGDAASTELVADLKGRNPGGVPTWIAWRDLDDDDDRIDFESVYGDVDNVMAYAVTYLDVEEEVTVNFGVSSDDAVHVLLDGDTLHANAVARGALARGFQDLPPEFENLHDVVLDAGRHTLMVKVFEGGGDHNFRIGFVDEFGEPIPGGPEEITISLDPLEELEKVLFRRGDANGDGTVNITDGVYVLNFLFTDLVEEVPCREATDANDDGGVNISDGLFILNHLFSVDGIPPPAPGPDACGENPAEEEDMSDCVYTTC